jgi:hypothetical protein
MQDEGTLSEHQAMLEKTAPAAPREFPRDPAEDQSMLDWLQLALEPGREAALGEFIRKISPERYDAWLECSPDEYKAVEVTSVLDYAPLITILKQGKASAAMQLWLAAFIERGGFKERRSIDERETYDYLFAIVDVPRITVLWRAQYGARNGTRRQAVECSAALHSLNADKLEKYASRSVADLRRFFR